MQNDFEILSKSKLQSANDMTPMSIIYRKLNLKLQINLIISLLLAIVMLLGAWMMIENAREDVRAEINSTTQLALHLLDAELLHYNSDYSWISEKQRNTPTIFNLSTLDNVRHLRIEFFDRQGKLRDSNRISDNNKESATPQWFEKLMSSVSSTLQPTHRSIVINNRILGDLVITPEPSYEIAEIWHDTFGLLGLVAIFFIAVNALVYWAVDHAMQPVSQILVGLNQLEQGRLNARLPEFKLPELSGVSTKFNAMAETLEKSTQSNYLLTQQIIRLQEDERKNLAQNLHDEIGQHLTAIHLDTSVIIKSTNIKSAHESAIAINSVVGKMMGIIRDMLHRLRPSTLDELGLQASLYELIEGWRSRNRGITTNTNISSDLLGLEETYAITIYRIIQECLTNISKHSNATQLTIKVELPSDSLRLLVADNGQGFDPKHTPRGFGLLGMRERVEGLGGSFDLMAAIGNGVQISINIPYKKKSPEWITKSL
jgi:two-component system sensor histidine kinase UhpB